jgi:hypothetical protein
MKKMIKIDVEAGKLPGKALDILIPTGCGPDVATISRFFHRIDTRDNTYFASEVANIHLEEGDPRIMLVQELAKELRADVDVEHYKAYSEEDRYNARLLIMGKDVGPSISRGCQAGTKFNREKGCWNCGTGMQQIWYLRVAKKDLPTVLAHRAVATFSNEIMIDADLRQSLLDNDVKGISFAEVHARNQNDDWVPIGRDQILIEHVMPPIRGVFPPDGEKAACKVCNRGGHQYLPEYFYREEDLEGIQDFNVTWEWFEGYSMADSLRECRPGRPEVLVTPKVMDIFRRAGVDTFEWTPVGIIS